MKKLFKKFKSYRDLLEENKLLKEYIEVLLNELKDK